MNLRQTFINHMDKPHEIVRVVSSSYFIKNREHIEQMYPSHQFLIDQSTNTVMICDSSNIIDVEFTDLSQES